MIRIQQEDFDIAAEIEALRKGRTDIGALVSFSGIVRGVSGGHPISQVTLEHYPGMTEKELQRIEHQARERWPVQESLIIHRFGALKPGDNIVLTLVAAVHRGVAFEAAEFIMDYLKTSAPFWKSESEADGNKWVSAKGKDKAALARWSDKG